MGMGEDVIAWMQSGFISLASATQIAAGWLKTPIALVLPIPGLIAFAWAWKDRKNRVRAESPYARWEIYPHPEEDGWHMSEIAIMNRWDEPLIGRKVRISGMRGCRMRHHSLPGTQEGVKSLTVRWEFRSSRESPASGVSGATLLYIYLPGLAQSGIAPSGSGGRFDASIQDKMDKLQLAIALKSSSNRKIRCIAQPTIMSDMTHARYGRMSMKDRP